MVFKNPALMNVGSMIIIPRLPINWLTGTVWWWSVENHACDSHVITCVLSLICVMPRLPSNQRLDATETCWCKQVDFQEWDVNPFMVFWLKV